MQWHRKFGRTGRPRLATTRLAPLSVVVSMTLIACGGLQEGTPTAGTDPIVGEEETAVARGESLPPCRGSLPDLSRLGVSARQQVQQRHTAVTAEDGAEAYGALGMILMAAKVPDLAESCLREAWSREPEQFQWPYYLGHLHRDDGALEQAAAFFALARDIQPDDVAVLVWLGDVYLAMGYPSRARPFFEDALTVEADSLSARFGLGRTALLEADFERAVNVLEDILARDPTAVAAHYPLGMAYRGMGETGRAERHLEQRQDAGLGPHDPLMIELDALLDSPRAHETRGVAALDRGDWNEAADHFRRGLALEPDHAALRHRVGTALYMMGDHVGALAEFERVVKTSPNYPGAHYSIGVILQADGRHAEAVERFLATLRYQPTDGDARLRLAVSLRRAGDPEEALRHFDTVLGMDSDIVDARFGAAMALVQLQRYADARDRLVAAMDVFPEQTIFSHALARILVAAPDANVRDGERALMIMERLVQTEQTIDAGETMAMTLAELGRYGEAVDIQRQLISASLGAGLSDITRRLDMNLQRYLRSVPVRVPWPADGVP